MANDGSVRPYEKPYASNGKVVMDNHPLMIMADQRRKNLLKHPLCLALVRHKWKSFGRYVYYSSLSLYGLFLLFLTSYVLIVPDPVEYSWYYNCSENGSYSKFFMEARQQEVNPDSPPPEKGPYLYFAQFGIYALVGLNMFLELVQLCRTGRRYFQWTNLFDWIVYILSFLLVFDFGDDAFKTGLRQCWQWELGAMAVVLAWLNLLGDIRQLPFLGIYVIMFFDILKTFLKFVGVFVVFIIAFGLGFHLLLIGSVDAPFSDVGYSLIKTTVMMIGEFEFDTIFYSGDLAFPVASIILFVAFLVIMAILLMNLLVGLAVDDIKAVQEQAVLKRLAMQVEQVLDVERVLPYFLLRRVITQYEVIHKKRTRWWHIFTDVVSSRRIVKVVTRSPQGVSNLRLGLIIALIRASRKLFSLSIESKL